MSLIIVSIVTMVAISEIWLDPKRDRSLLEKYPLLAGIIPVLTAARDGLLRVSASVSETEKKRQALSVQAAELNDRFDDACRAFHGAITGCLLVSDAPLRTTLEEIRDSLLPEGLSCINSSYLDKLGVVEIAESKMTEVFVGILLESSVNGKNLHQLFMEWVAWGQQLGSVARQRDLLSGVDSSDQITPSDIRQAKSKWVQAARALSSLLELDSEIPKDVRSRLLQPLLDAEVKLVRKKAEADEGESNTETPEDGDGDGENGNSKPPSPDSDGEKHTTDTPKDGDDEASDSPANPPQASESAEG